MPTDQSPTPYDRTPYPTFAFEQTHPDRLATVATLFGMNPAPPRACRVLELGCASGGNLLPMAFGLPEATFLGVDLSARQIAKGQERLHRLGLRNVTLEHRDILDVGPELGKFDYIIAHGIFSWVPQPVQEKMLEIYRDLLAPEGVGYISYATYPGCHTRRALRDIMRFHTRILSDPAERVGQARAAAAFLPDAVLPVQAQWKGLLERERDRISRLDDDILLHDDLAEINDPIYFHELADRAGRHGLKYLGEARFHEMFPQSYSREVREALEASGDVIVFEQYLDFLRGRAFRQTLLCHEEVQLRRLIVPEVVMKLCAEGHAAPKSDAPDIRSRAPEQFVAPGVGITVTAPITKAGMVHLRARAPEVLTFAEVLAGARALLGDEAAPEGDAAQAEARELAESLLGAFGVDATVLRPRRISLARAPGDRPAASPPARLLAEEGISLTNLLHRRVVVEDPFERELLKHLTGEKTRPQLAEILADAVVEGRVTLEEGAPLPDGRHAVLRAVEPRLTQALEKMGRDGLLLA